MRQAEPGESRSRIIVTNFDSVTQARLWREKGSMEATEQLLAMLRTAVLLGEDLQLDRNQLFDGVFFLALGPDQLSAELGLPAGAPLPIKLTGSATPGMDKAALQLFNDEAPLTYVQAARVRAAVDEFVTTQLTHVRSPDFLASSSALMALIGAKEGNEWLLPPAGGSWFPGAGIRHRLDPLPTGARHRRRALDIIEHAQDEWADAVRADRLNIGLWKGTIPITEGLGLEEAALALAGTKPTELAAHMLGFDSPVRKVALDELSAAARRHWGGDDAHGRSFNANEERELRYALELWSRGYYRAIAHRDGAMLVAFAEASLEPNRRDPLRRAYGLEAPLRSPWERIRERFQRRDSDRRFSAMRIDGEILDHMREIHPGSFRQLTRTSAKVLTRIRQRDASAMMDLALATREAVSSVPSRRSRVIRNAGRIVGLSLVAILVAVLAVVPDVVDLSRGQQVTVIIVSAVIGAVAGLPWDDIVGMFRLRRTALTATLNINTTDRIQS